MISPTTNSPSPTEASPDYSNFLDPSALTITGVAIRNLKHLTSSQNALSDSLLIEPSQSIKRKPDEDSPSIGPLFIKKSTSQYTDKRPNLLIRCNSSELGPRKPLDEGVFRQAVEKIYATQNSSTKTIQIELHPNHFATLNLIGSGAFSNVYSEEFDDISSFYQTEIPIVVKILKRSRLAVDTYTSPKKENEGIITLHQTGEDKIAIALYQYDLACDFFNQDTIRPIVKIYNEENALSCGYTVVEKVTPLTESPWKNIVSLEAMTPQQKQDLESAIQLMRLDNHLRSLYENGNKISALDIKLTNLGRNTNGDLVLLDYVNAILNRERYEENTITDLAMGNEIILQELYKVAREESLDAAQSPWYPASNREDF